MNVMTAIQSSRIRGRILRAHQNARMRKQIHPHFINATTIHTNGATTWSFASRLVSPSGGGNIPAPYEVSDVDVFLVRKGRAPRVGENALSRFKKR